MDSNEKPQSVDSRKRSQSMNGYVDFYEKIKKSTCTKAAIFAHSFPDPDALSSMMAMAFTLEKVFGIKSELFYSGEVSHPQNGIMLNLLNAGFIKLTEDNYKKDLYGLNILVDTIPENAGVDSYEIKFDVVVDHHRELPQNFDGVLVHQKVGACASIIYDMMKHLIPEEDFLDEDNDSDQKLATALIAGIVTDTEYMMSEDSTELEFKAFSGLFPYRNSALLKQIVFFKRPKLWIDKKAEGCKQANISEEGWAIVGLGIISDKHRDLIADMAEEMVHWTSVETAVAFGVVGGDKIQGSIRSLNPSLTVCDFCKKLGGKHGKGGGKQGKGAYTLSLAGFSIDPDEDEEDVTEAWESIKNRETKRIMRILRK